MNKLDYAHALRDCRTCLEYDKRKVRCKSTPKCEHGELFKLTPIVELYEAIPPSHEMLALCKRIANLNPAAGEIGPAMLAFLVEDARSILRGV